MKRFSLLYLLILSSALCAWAEASFSVVPPRTVIAGNRFSVTFRLKDGEGSSLKVPDIEGCELLFGPATSTMSSIQIINGRRNASTTVDYTYTYRATKEGTFTIPAATIVVDNKVLKSSPAQFKVLPPDSNSDPSAATISNSSQIRNNAQEVSSKDVFIRIILNKSRAYKEEAIECIMKLYTKYESVSGISAQTPPVFDGFLIEEDNNMTQTTDVEHYNGENYLTAVLRKYIIFPQKTGKLTINSGKYDITVVQYERINQGFFSTARPVERTVHVNPGNLTVDILPLPEPVPANFSGAVGSYQMSSTLSSPNLRTGEAATLTVHISGTGDIKYINEPQIQFPDEFELYTPKSDVNARISGSTVSGTATYEYTFIPQSVGTFRIPATDFVYFNPTTKKYETLSTENYEVSIAKGAGTSSVASTQQQEVEIKATDVRHIKNGEKNLNKDVTPVFYKIWYWGLYVGLALLLIIISAIYSKQMSLNADIVARRKAKAGKIAKKKLLKARTLLNQGKTEAFYEELLHALWGFAADRLSLPGSKLSRGNIQQKLTEAGVSEETTDDFISLIDQCEMARYTPSATEEELEAIYNKAHKTLKEMA